jgi:hypothetical protein
LLKSFFALPGLGGFCILNLHQLLPVSVVVHSSKKSIVMSLQHESFYAAYQRILYHYEQEIKNRLRQARDRAYLVTVIQGQVERYKAELYSHDYRAPVAHIYLHYHKTGQRLEELLPILRYEFSPENLKLRRDENGQLQLRHFDVLNGVMTSHNFSLADEKIVPMLQENEQLRQLNERRLRLLEDTAQLKRILVETGLLEDIPGLLPKWVQEVEQETGETTKQEPEPGQKPGYGFRWVKGKEKGARNGLVQLCYALFKAGYMEGDVKAFVEAMNELTGAGLSVHWQDNHRKSIHNTKNDYQPQIFQQLTVAYERWMGEEGGEGEG